MLALYNAWNEWQHTGTCEEVKLGAQSTCSLGEGKAKQFDKTSIWGYVKKEIVSQQSKL